MDRHATKARAHLQIFLFPVLHKHVSMKFRRLVVNKGCKSSLESVFQPHCSASGISSSSTDCHHKYVDLGLPCLVVLSARP